MCNTVDECTCQYIHKEDTTWHKCRECETINDLTTVQPDQFNQSGNIILGGLLKYGCVVGRGVQINDTTHIPIHIVAYKRARPL